MEYFSLLWDSEENYAAWSKDVDVRDNGYIDDLNLKYVYKEIHRLSRFGDQYDFEKVFLHPCTELSTVVFRQNIMEQLYNNQLLYVESQEIVACISETQKKIGRIRDTKDEMKQQIFYLQMLYEFLTDIGEVYERLIQHISKETLLFGKITKLADCIVGSEAKRERELLSEYLIMLHQNTPCNIILNKDKEQVCHSVVIDEEETHPCGFTDRLKKAAMFFWGEWDFSIGVYQNNETSLDKKILEYINRQSPQLAQETVRLYERYGNFDFVPLIQLANELAFYLSCIRFRREYEQAGFYFTRPFCTSVMTKTSVKGAYDMTLGINQFKSEKHCLAVPNDYNFDIAGDGVRIFILTGANQGGKTTFIRSIGIIQCLAQIGMFVPAEEAALGIVKHIHTLFGRGDEMAALSGRFEQELQRVHDIQGHLEEGDMVLLNEPFTSTQRVVAVILLKQLLSEFGKHHCIGGLVTHFHEIYSQLQDDCFYSLVAGVTGKGESKQRTFKIMRMESYHKSYAKDIAVKHGVTYEQLIATMELVGKE